MSLDERVRTILAEEGADAVLLVVVRKGRNYDYKYDGDKTAFAELVGLGSMALTQIDLELLGK